MKIYFLMGIIFFNINLSLAQTSFSIVNTGYADSFDFLSRENGNFVKRKFNHSAFVIKHNGKTILFETGIGENIDSEFNESMPFWARPLFHYNYVRSLKSQIGDIKYDFIFLSHVHWDHAGGLTDNLGTRPSIPKEELEELDKETLKVHRTFPIHFKNSKPKIFKWKKEKYLSFNKYFDPFDDGKLIIVPLPGHSFGSVGIIINGSQGKYFFVGDAVWVEEQIDTISHKFCVSSSIVDRNKKTLTKSIKLIKEMKEKYGFMVIPTHDSGVQNKLGYFPKWIEVP